MIDASDPGKAALVAFAAAWLFSRTSEMNAENSRRQAAECLIAYSDDAFMTIQREAIALATTGELPPWTRKGR